MASMMMEKGLEAHPTKTGYSLFKGNKQDKQKM